MAKEPSATAKPSARKKVVPAEAAAPAPADTVAPPIAPADTVAPPIAPAAPVAAPAAPLVAAATDLVADGQVTGEIVLGDGRSADDQLADDLDLDSEGDDLDEDGDPLGLAALDFLDEDDSLTTRLAVLTPDERAEFTRLLIKLGAPADILGDLQSALGEVALRDAEALLDAGDLPDLAGHVLEVRSLSKAGRRRIGRQFGPEPTLVAVDDLTADQLGQLIGDPLLVVSHAA